MDVSMRGHVFLVLALAGLCTGCAGDYVARTRDVRRAYEASDHERALALLEKQKKEAREIDRLLYLLDEGMLLHAAGTYGQSIETLRRAEQLAAELDAVSVSEEARTFLGNERERAYRGEDFEKLMINVLLALDYAELGEEEEALVEVRRVNERLRKMVSDEKKPYQQLAIARYLSGVLWEDQNDLDSAAIDYEAAFDQMPEMGHLGQRLLLIARATGREQFANKLMDQNSNLSSFAKPLGPQEGQLVVIIEAGLSPEKVNVARRPDGSEDAELISVPAYRDRWRGGRAQVQAGGQDVRAVVVTDIGAVAKTHLDHRVGRMVTKQLAALAVKAGAATAIGAATKSAELGALTFVLLNINNRPDLRAWMSLPAQFQVARLQLPAGKQEVAVDLDGQRTTHTVEVTPGRIALLRVRRYR